MAKSKKYRQGNKVRLPDYKQIERIIENSAEAEPKQRVRRVNNQPKLEN